jgi:hypothetical protein
MKNKQLLTDCHKVQYILAIACTISFIIGWRSTQSNLSKIWFEVGFIVVVFLGMCLNANIFEEIDRKN